MKSSADTRLATGTVSAGASVASFCRLEVPAFGPVRDVSAPSPAAPDRHYKKTIAPLTRTVERDRFRVGSLLPLLFPCGIGVAIHLLLCFYVFLLAPPISSRFCHTPASSDLDGEMRVESVVWVICFVDLISSSLSIRAGLSHREEEEQIRSGRDDAHVEC